MRKELKIPTLIGLILLALGVAAGVFLVQQGQLFNLRASPEETPKQVRITNVGSRSFTVSWTTDRETVGFVSYGKSSSLGQTAGDDVSNSEPAFLHHVTISALEPGTVYFFKIGSGDNLFDNNGQPYQTTTAGQLAGTASTDIVFGTVKDEVGAPAESLVYVTIPGGSPLSTTTEATGKWTVPLSRALSSSLTSYATFSGNDRMQIFVQARSGKFASATILIGSAKPVPPITLGQTHDFTNLKPADSSGLPASNITLPQELAASPSSGFKIEDQESAEGARSVKITAPKEEENVNTTRPQFVGTGTPGTIFTIVVESPAGYTDQVSVGTNGSWSWTPPENLEPGEHTVTVSWKDENGQTRLARRTFTVLAAGTSDLPSFSASPSGSIATASPSPSPTATPSARTSLPSTESGVPVSGNLTATLGVFIIGVVLILTGVFLPRIIKL